jgi:hypothetical protein
MRGDRYNGRSSETDEFYEAMDMAKEGLERVCELAEEMREQYGGRGSYGRRHEDWEDDGYGERRRRDSRGRYL